MTVSLLLGPPLTERASIQRYVSRRLQILYWTSLLCSRQPVLMQYVITVLYTLRYIVLNIIYTS